MRENDTDRVLREYEEARRKAGTVGDGMPAWRVTRNGWFSIGYGNYRKKEVEEMTRNLLVRAEQNTTGT